MINIFNIKKNDRYIYDGQTIVIAEISSKTVSWYFLREWIDSGQGSVNLHKSSRLELLFKAKKI